MVGGLRAVLCRRQPFPPSHARTVRDRSWQMGRSKDSIGAHGGQPAPPLRGDGRRAALGQARPHAPPRRHLSRGVAAVIDPPRCGWPACWPLIAPLPRADLVPRPLSRPPPPPRLRLLRPPLLLLLLQLPPRL